MANTTNYNWETPDDTDLVKDGAAAIRTLGNSIDTTTKALNPQTTLGDIAYRSSTSNTNTRLPIGSNGQILGVSAGVPAWINNDQGDITEVQAGTGISVASGTGPIPVVTNTVATAYDAKGDLVVGTGADAFSRLGVGTNDYVLTAASGEATGLKWAAVTPATFPAFRAYSSGGTSLASTAYTKLTFNTEVFDTDSKFASDRFTPTVAGYYQVSARAELNASGGSNEGIVAIYKNGSADAEDSTLLNPYPSGNPCVLIYLDADDYIEVYFYTQFSASTNGGASKQYFSAVGIRS